MSLPVGPFFRSQVCTQLPVPTKSFAGQTIIVTGSNTGMGLEAARHMVRLGAAKMILAVRSLERGAAAAKSIAETTGRGDAVEVWDLDLASHASVRAFAVRAAGLERLDVVVENAGVYGIEFARAEDNERTITVNFVSTMLLALLLLPKLRETAVAFDKDVVLTFTGSFVHWLTDFPERNADNILELLAREDKARMADRYNVSKMMELLAFRELATALTQPSNTRRIVTSIINPGAVITDIMREARGFFYLYVKAMQKMIMRTAEEGGRTLVHAAEGGRETDAKYLCDCQPAPPELMSHWVRSKEAMVTQKKVWKELLDKLESIQPGISKNI
ncbi:related to enoyl-CoA hydratase/isomerase [Cephalotrichum gorgonifer]|uniref:Related to enoyl-CoA hydratase/isomerase n=1 Tax=Cephalotrichum gorgonifer TaxID=2041049 RepID=A0AAE8N8B9_9PEZI|nr:related to enoyl-CoA hydratase/isomerase [Cephalotrichum gorgonifer]